MKKQFLRVKQIADQTFLRAEKSDVMTEDLVIAEKRVDSIKLCCQSSQKKISSCQIDLGSETSLEKRLKKIPQVLLGISMLENGNNISKNSVLGDTLRECASVQTKLGSQLLDYYLEVEKCVLKPVSSILDNELHNISKLRKQLGKHVLDMDSARTRFQTAERHSMQASSNSNFNTVGKVDNLKEELEEASLKVDQCRDSLATEMFNLISKEPQLAQLFVQLHELQAAYHRNALSTLECSLPLLDELIHNFPQKPVYGCSLEDHLRVTNREIAQVIETCVSFLIEYGLSEEGLLRITGSASKVKKLKSAFDAGIELDMEEYVRDPHAVSGAFKSYLRELPEPLLKTDLYNEWIQAAKISEVENKLAALKQVLSKLPDANFKNLKFVIKFLSKLQENMDVNKMNSQNIAIVMAPNLIWSPIEDPTIGMNMSTASLHTAIIDYLISYSEWFFPDVTYVNPPQKSGLYPNLNEIQKGIETIEVFTEPSEVNGNNLQAIISVPDDICSSPRSPHKLLKKVAAPPPPPPHNSNDLPTTQLIDFTETSVNPTTESASYNSAGNSFSKEHFDSFPKELHPHKPERPSVPDKPSYSSYSLDRKAHRQSSIPSRNTSARTATGDLMTRSHIERPSVPPPERPNKLQKCPSSENLSTVCVEQGDGDKPITSPPITDEKLNNCNPAVLVPTKEAPIPLQRSKSNRFDFLVNQKEEKPPERPPRSMVLDPLESKSDVSLVQGGEVFSESKPNLPPPVSPKPAEIEKVKPPRPLPPAKPKLNQQTENTTL